MPWQKAQFIEPTEDREPFWVQTGPPEPGAYPELNSARDGFEAEHHEGMWYKTNVLAPSGAFCMLASHNGVELLSEIAEDVPLDDRYLLP